MRKNKGSALVWVIISVVAVFLLWAMTLPCCPNEAKQSLKASIIVSNLRDFKTAALAWYVDNLDSFDKEGTIFGKAVEDFADSPESVRAITSYFNSKRKPPTLRGKSARPGEYILTCGRNSREWLIGYNLDGEDERVRHKLSGRAKSVGLLNNPSPESPLYTPESNRVWLLVMTLTGE